MPQVTRQIAPDGMYTRTQKAKQQKAANEKTFSFLVDPKDVRRSQQLLRARCLLLIVKSTGGWK